MFNSQTNARPRWRCLALFGMSAAVFAGCGDSAPYELAPVSGVVTLDGNVVPYTQVTFMPKGSVDNPNPGPGSTANCDEAGHFELKSIRGETGAVVGQHTVQISATGPPRPSSSDAAPGPEHKEKFPARFNTNSELTFEVPADGTTAADFKLTTKP